MYYPKKKGKKTIEKVTFVAFDSSYYNVVLGQSVKDGQRKCFGGDFDTIGNFAMSRDKETILAKDFGHEKFEEGTGIKRKQFSLVEDEPFWSRPIPSRHSVHWFFLAFLKPNVEFSARPDSKSDIVDPRLIPFDDVLCSYRNTKSYGLKINPFHLIAVCRAVQRLARQAHRCDVTEKFFIAYDSLIQKGVHISSYEQRVRDSLPYK